ncbi:MAG: alpha/beta hydrolase [Chitinophagaceae bacterium]|nr:alpha/beta hydrolase [Chitinophagaceae bacterium]
MIQLKIRGSNHFYRDLNTHKKETILLVHGHPFDNSMWDYQLHTLKDFRLILPDLKGYGKTDYRFDKIYIEEQALDLAILLDHLEIEKVHLIGLSMGGQIIIEFARLFPHRTISLIICDSNPSAENETSYKNRLLLAEKINSIGIIEYTNHDINKYLNQSTIDNNKEVYQHLYKMMTATKTEGAVASHKGRAERRNNCGYLKSIRFPTLVIVGDSDFFTPAAEMQDIANQISNSEFEVIPNAGHMPNMEQPEIFNKVIDDFYEKYASR